jgi:hypothetical protein
MQKESALREARTEEKPQVISMLIKALEQHEAKMTQRDISLIVVKRTSQKYIDKYIIPAIMAGETTSFKVSTDIINKLLLNIKHIRWANSGLKIRYELEEDVPNGTKFQAAYDGEYTYYYEPSKMTGTISNGQKSVFKIEPEVAWLTGITSTGMVFSELLRRKQEGVNYEGQQLIGDTDCLRVTVEIAKGIKQTIWFCPQYDYSVRRIKMSVSILELDDFQEYDGIWFPGKGIYVKASDEQAQKDAWDIFMRWRLVGYSASAPDTLFGVKPTPADKLFPIMYFPSGTKIIDQRRLVEPNKDTLKLEEQGELK